MSNVSYPTVQLVKGVAGRHGHTLSMEACISTITAIGTRFGAGDTRRQLYWRQSYVQRHRQRAWCPVVETLSGRALCRAVDSAELEFGLFAPVRIMTVVRTDHDRLLS